MNSEKPQFLTFEKRWNSLRLFHRPDVDEKPGLESEAVAYFFFSKFLDKEWLETIEGTFASNRDQEK